MRRLSVQPNERESHPGLQCWNVFTPSTGITPRWLGVYSRWAAARLKHESDPRLNPNREAETNLGMPISGSRMTEVTQQLLVNGRFHRHCQLVASWSFQRYAIVLNLVRREKARGTLVRGIDLWSFSWKSRDRPGNDLATATDQHERMNRDNPNLESLRFNLPSYNPETLPRWRCHQAWPRHLSISIKSKSVRWVDILHWRERKKTRAELRRDESLRHLGARIIHFWTYRLPLNLKSFWERHHQDRCLRMELEMAGNYRWCVSGMLMLLVLSCFLWFVKSGASAFYSWLR